MGWSWKDTLELPPKQLISIQESLIEIIKRENGEKDNKVEDKIRSVQTQELEKRLTKLKNSGTTKIPIEKLLGALGR